MPLFNAVRGVASPKATRETEITSMEWNKTTMPSTAYWKSVCYGDGKFVAVAQNSDAVAYSEDGIIWIQTELPISANWHSVCYGDDKFVAIANNSDAIVYSEDGITWNLVTLSSTNYSYNVCYGNGVFLSVGSSTTCLYSTDGITWNTTKLPASACHICYGDNKFVAIYDNSGVAVYSEDGITWNTTTIPTARWQSICYGNGKFLGVAYFKIAAYSEDGVIWSQIELPITNYTARYGNGKFLVFSNSGGSTIIYSIDCINWSETSFPSGYATYSDLCYGNGIYVAVARSSDKAAYSLTSIKSNIKALDYIDIDNDGTKDTYRYNGDTLYINDYTEIINYNDILTSIETE